MDIQTVQLQISQLKAMERSLINMGDAWHALDDEIRSLDFYRLAEKVKIEIASLELVIARQLWG